MLCVKDVLCSWLIDHLISKKAFNYEISLFSAGFFNAENIVHHICMETHGLFVVKWMAAHIKLIRYHILQWSFELWVKKIHKYLRIGYDFRVGDFAADNESIEKLFHLKLKIPLFFLLYFYVLHSFSLFHKSGLFLVEDKFFSADVPILHNFLNYFASVHVSYLFGVCTRVIIIELKVFNPSQDLIIQLLLNKLPLDHCTSIKRFTILNTSVNLIDLLSF